MKKRELEEALAAEKEARRAAEDAALDLEQETNQLRAETAVRARAELAEVPLDMLLQLAAKKIDQAIVEAGSRPARQWTLTIIRKALRALNA